MGCDIHLHTEIKLNGTWEHYGCPGIGRNYRLFAKMAGVRVHGYIDPIAELRGLPSDISAVTKLDAELWKHDGYNHSWLSCEEISQLETWLKNEHRDDGEYWFPEMLWGYLFGNSFGGFSKYKTDYPKEIEDVRFVFWFDN